MYNSKDNSLKWNHFQQMCGEAKGKILVVLMVILALTIWSVSTSVGEATEEMEAPASLIMTPIVPDMSGYGNNAILRGSPAWITGKFGKALHLDGTSAYVEIPESKIFYTDEYTAIVWANIEEPGVAKAVVSGDIPLLAKGKYLGSGPNYMFRMVLSNIRKYLPGGVITAGVGVDNREFIWDGGPISLGEWAKYASTYDGYRGRTYVDLELAAEAIGGGKPLYYHEGYPLVAGLGWRGSEQGWPTYLDGKIDEIRFYTVALSEEELQQVYEHPGETGPQSERLVLWLTFEEILTSGTHTTEWRSPGEAQDQSWTWHVLEATAEVAFRRLPGEINATIEVSDDGATVKDAVTISLENGTNQYDISQLKAAQYIRVVTSFETIFRGVLFFIPKLERYAISTTSGTTTAELVWNTRGDWTRGEMTPTVSLEPTAYPMGPR